ncbi:MAG: TRAP transporter small permease subunit [Alphaproteobacteria bacterium]|nr:TRAP transporter small permease subunit [Alphaproteobacteria bacterium]
MIAITLGDIESGKDGRPWAMAFRIFALSIIAICVGFLVNNYLTFWREWPGIGNLFSHLEWFGAEALGKPLADSALLLAWIQILLYASLVGIVAKYVHKTSERGLRVDAEYLSGLAAFIIRAAFWSVLLIGFVDAIISFLRVEGFLSFFVGDKLTTELGLSRFRGAFVHYPLILVSIVIAYLTRTLGFAWLALLVVIAELQIVIARFIFSYEQAFMGDLVRFWYAALFLFASAYTLTEEGHVRVDVIYTGFNERGKAWTNALGALFLGLPLCWIILSMGMAGRATVINSPLLSFETSQSGFGLYVKYLMAGFLAVFAISMMVQFISSFLSSVADLRGEPGKQKPANEPAH